MFNLAIHNLVARNEPDLSNDVLKKDVSSQIHGGIKVVIEPCIPIKKEIAIDGTIITTCK